MAKQLQCPHCLNFKVRREGAHYWKLAFLLFAFGIPLLFAFGLGLFLWLGALYAVVCAVRKSGESRCLQCGWHGMIPAI
jgi:hypothetical protein